MVRVEQLIAEVLESSDSDVAGNDDVGDFRVGLVDIPGIERLHAHEADEFIGLFGQEYQDDDDEDDDTHSAFFTVRDDITIAHSGQSHHHEVDHFMEGHFRVLFFTQVVLVVGHQLFPLRLFKCQDHSTGHEHQSQDGQDYSEHLSTH